MEDNDVIVVVILAPSAPGRPTVVAEPVSESCRVPLLASTECRAHHVVPRNPGKYSCRFPSRANMEYNIASSSCASIAISAVAIAKPALLQLAKVRFVIGACHVVRVARLHFPSYFVAILVMYHDLGSN